MERLQAWIPAERERAVGTTGAMFSAIAVTVGMALLVAGASLQRAFEPETIGALAVFLWPAWLFGAVLVVLGVAAFGAAVLSVAATLGLVLVRHTARAGSAS